MFFATPRIAYPTLDNPATAASCTAKVTGTAISGGETFNTVLIYPGNNFEGFFTVEDPTGTVKAYTVYTPNGPFDNQKYYYLQVLRAVANDQYWIWDGSQMKNGVTVTGGGDVGKPHIPVPAVPAN